MDDDDLDSDMELNSGSEAEGNIERLSEHPSEISEGEADEEESEKELPETSSDSVFGKDGYRWNTKPVR